MKQFLICDDDSVEIPVAKVRDLHSFHLQHATTASYQKPMQPLQFLENLNDAYEYAVSFRQNHPGYDCFVTDVGSLIDISKAIGNVFTGYPPVGGILARAANDVSRMRGKLCNVVANLHSTFHVGSRNSDWGDESAKRIIDLNGDLVGSTNFSSSYLLQQTKSMLRKSPHRLGIMKCPLMKFSLSQSRKCFW